MSFQVWARTVREGYLGEVGLLERSGSENVCWGQILQDLLNYANKSGLYLNMKKQLDGLKQGSESI